MYFFEKKHTFAFLRKPIVKIRLNSFKTMTKALIIIIASILGMSGSLAMFDPGYVGDGSGLNPSLAGLTEIRATFGGFHWGFVIFLFWCCFSEERYRYALLSIALMMGGAALGRLGGIVVDGMPTNLHYSALCIEIPVALAAVWLLQKRNSHPDLTNNSAKS